MQKLSNKYRFFLLIGLLLIINKLLYRYYVAFIFSGKFFYHPFLPETTAETIYHFDSFILGVIGNVCFLLPVLGMVIWLFALKKKLLGILLNFKKK